jgi:hypothetical protein
MEKHNVDPGEIVDSAWPEGPATEINLSQSGYLLRGCLSVSKIMEANQHLVDAVNAS